MIDSARKTDLYRWILRVRRSEQRLAELYKQGTMRTPTHFGVGQEAVAVGVCQALEQRDVIYSHHRCHNHYLAKGGSLLGLVAELFGRETGCSRGRGGSVHLTDLDAGVVATSAILGQTIAVAVGSALAFKMDRAPRVAVSFFGEAACEEGVFYESINYAAIHRLPVLLVCENNLYSTESPLCSRQAPGSSLCERVRSFKMTAEEVDGNDLFSVFDAAERAKQRCLAGEGPVFLECFTYRWLEHVGPHFDHELGRTYRSREEVEAWMARCPVERTRRALLAEGLASEAELAAWQGEIDLEIEEAVARAQEAPWPDPKDLFENVY
jgi:TPP-dependent pyruvate/acetoin dehydrogenase alpha subunit